MYFHVVIILRWNTFKKTIKLVRNPSSVISDTRWKSPTGAIVAWTLHAYFTYTLEQSCRFRSGFDASSMGSGMNMCVCVRVRTRTVASCTWDGQCDSHTPCTRRFRPHRNTRLRTRRRRRLLHCGYHGNGSTLIEVGVVVRMSDEISVARGGWSVRMWS